MKNPGVILSKAGQRHTAQRALLLDLIYRSRGHIDAANLYQEARQKSSALSLSTIYRNLKLFKDLGLVQEHQFGNSTHYYEPQVQRHHHLVCLGCGRVFEFRCQSTGKLKHQLSIRKGFQVVDTEVRITGYCPKCQKEGGSNHRQIAYHGKGGD